MAEKERKGYFGDWGGSYVPETLMAPLEELTRSYDRLRGRRAFQRELADLLANYAGRPTALYHARRLSDSLGGARIYLKREDLLHTGAHKLNNALGQALLARDAWASGASSPRPARVSTASPRRPPRRSSAWIARSTWARRTCAASGPNVFRMRLLGAEVVGVDSGTPHAQGRHQRGHARLGDERPRHPLHPRLGAGPAPVPAHGAGLPAVIGARGRAQSSRSRPAACPTSPIACVGGGSATRSGSFTPFSTTRTVRLIGVEAGGSGDRLGRARRSLPRRQSRECSTARAPTCSRTTTARSP